ncbi:MAG: hypothetical protein E6G47_11355 [Actinobacteria bacterium]|nr:MAG: hypothetical protein E6G47_11355 [Actinomycetota bacterium]
MPETSVNIEQLKVFGMTNLANVILGVTLVTPIFGSGPFALSSVIGLGLVIAIVLYGGALDILSGV